MQRRGGKRIRMDDPPPEYENPMTPALDPDAGYGQYANPPNGRYLPPFTFYNSFKLNMHNPMYTTVGLGMYVDTNTYGEHANMSGSSDGMFESPPTPGMRRVTRARTRGANAPAPPPMIDSPPSPSPPRTTFAPRGRPRGRPPGRKQHHEGGIDDNTSLYQIIKISKASLTSIVDDWIETYKVSYNYRITQNKEPK